MTWWTLNYPVCEYCGDVFDKGVSDKGGAVRLAIKYGWQALETQWIMSAHDGKSIPVEWTFYCPTHLRDDDE